MAGNASWVVAAVVLGVVACSSESPQSASASSGGSAGAATGGSSAGGSGGTAGVAGATGGAAGSAGASCGKLPSGFSSGASEICNGSDDDGDGEIDDAQTGWSGFCQRSALVPPSTYPFIRSLAEYQSAFDSIWAGDKATELAHAASCNPCDQEPYYLQGPFKALLTMHRATGEARYLDDAMALADAMIAASDPYDASGAAPSDAGCFDAWATSVPGGLRYWSTLGCTPTDASWRYQLNELQGLRGISELARVLAAKGDTKSKKYLDYADQVVTFYAMLGASKDAQGKCQPHPRIDSAADKRSHFVVNAVDLYHASGDARFLDWAKELIEKQLSTVIADDGDFLKLYVTESAQEINDVSHANREVELIRTLFELGEPGSGERVRRAVNTLLFRVWENDPSVTIDGSPAYPFLFRSFVDGSNACAGSNPPYRTGSVTMGWHELGRYDARVLHLMERLTIGLLEKSVPTSLPAAGGCPANGNTNYSFVLPALAEMAYVSSLVTKQCGP